MLYFLLVLCDFPFFFSMCLVIVVVAVIVVAAAVVFGERASHSQVCSIKNHYIYYGTYVIFAL